MKIVYIFRPGAAVLGPLAGVERATLRVAIGPQFPARGPIVAFFADFSLQENLQNLVP